MKKNTPRSAGEAFMENPPIRDAFSRKLLAWFASAMRPFPWRETYDPYSVWISEIMLQQTQAERGARRFGNWMRLFPDIRSVAMASEEAVLAAWEGLGYYSRARNLRAAAIGIMADHGGVFPDSFDAIRALPGIGEYTAGAVAAIAFNQPVAAVDANVLRIFSRILDIDSPVGERKTRERATEAVLSLMPPGEARHFSQALMELGALVCGKAPKCADCPVREHCLAHARGVVSDRPVAGKKPRRNLIAAVAGVVARRGRVFVRKRPPSGLWAGLHEFPGGEMAPGEKPEEAVVRLLLAATGLAVAVRSKIATVRHGYTTNSVTLHGYLCEMGEETDDAAPGGRGGAWILPGELGLLAFPAGHRKLIERLGWK